jgi:hypothetical protein
VIALTAALAVALSLGADDGRARPSASAGGRAAPAALSNAARAKMGLLPRKAPRKAPQARRAGRRIITTVSHQPTFLGEPIPLAEAPPERGELEAALEAPLAVVAPREVRDLRVSVSSVVTDVTMVLRYGP